MAKRFTIVMNDSEKVLIYRDKLRSFIKGTIKKGKNQEADLSSPFQRQWIVQSVIEDFSWALGEIKKGEKEISLEDQNGPYKLKIVLYTVKVKASLFT